jgi:hypothetical protein
MGSGSIKPIIGSVTRWPNRHGQCRSASPSFFDCQTASLGKQDSPQSFGRNPVAIWRDQASASHAPSGPFTVEWRLVADYAVMQLCGTGVRAALALRPAGRAVH